MNKGYLLSMGCGLLASVLLTTTATPVLAACGCSNPSQSSYCCSLYQGTWVSAPYGGNYCRSICSSGPTNECCCVYLGYQWSNGRCQTSPETSGHPTSGTGFEWTNTTTTATPATTTEEPYTETMTTDRGGDITTTPAETTTTVTPETTTEPYTETTTPMTTTPETTSPETTTPETTTPPETTSTCEEILPGT